MPQDEPRRRANALAVAASAAQAGQGGSRSGRLRFLVLRSGALGDFVLTLPVLSGVRRLFPEAEITLAAKASYGRLALASGLADTVISEDSPEVVRLYAESAEGGRVLRERHGAFDVAVSFVLSGEVRRNLLAAGVGTLLCRAPRPHSPSGLHAADHLLAALSGIERLPGPAVPRLTLRDEELRRAEALLHGKGLEPRKYLALHPGSGSLAKNWPLERFVQAARRVQKQLGLKVVLLTGPAEEEHRADFEDAFGGACDASVCTPDLVTLAGVLAMSAAYLGNDSGVTHLAAAVGAKVVAVFGPTNPAVWGPRGEKVRVLRHESGEVEKVGVEEVISLLRQSHR